MATFTVNEVLRQLDEDSDSDFEGYIDEDEYLENEKRKEAEENGILSIEDIQEECEISGDSLDSDSTQSTSSIPEYSATQGAKQDMTNKSPVDFFRLLIPDPILQEVVDQTNLYADQFFQDANVPPKSRTQLWESTQHNLDELKKFLCLVIIMECIHYPAIEDYWSTSWPFATVTFSSVLKRDRFSLVLRFLHLNDNSKYIAKGQPGHDPLYKIRPFMESLIQNFQSAYTPGREIALDESMIGFKGRLGFLQYMPKKPTKWGLKAFVIADSVTGYGCNWKLYTGIKTKKLAHISLSISNQLKNTNS